MIRINQIKLNTQQSEDYIETKIRKALHLKPSEKFTYRIVKKSIDARKKDNIMFVYSVNVVLQDKIESTYIQKIKDPNIMILKETLFQFPKSSYSLESKIVIVGSGPAGLMCGLFLARAGYKPIIFERGDQVENRIKIVNHFWNSGELDFNTNVQFGEGGAGTFSDGKLNTVVKEKSGRIFKILSTFVEFGAPKDILYTNKPHIGTDILSQIVKNIRNEIINLGGEVHFLSKITDIKISQNQIKAVRINDSYDIECDKLVLAIGHSARDTFSLIRDKNFKIESKAFAVGLRIEHSQNMINQNAYGTIKSKKFPVADYKITAKTSYNRGVYSFCMCPGGYVVNASSEQNHLCVNGMSYSKRDGKNANSAIIVTIDQNDFQGTDSLSGLEFQKKLEKAAYIHRLGMVPYQLNEDFQKGIPTTCFGEIIPQIIGAHTGGNLREVLPEFLSEAIIEAMTSFERSIHGFNRGDAVFSGIESRTSSPIRILRDDSLQSITYKNIYPCGEGAGYAGGITSASVDGLKVAESIVSSF